MQDGMKAGIAILIAFILTGFAGFLTSVSPVDVVKTSYDRVADLTPNVIATDVDSYDEYYPATNVTGWSGDVDVIESKSSSPYILSTYVGGEEQTALRYIMFPDSNVNNGLGGSTYPTSYSIDNHGWYINMENNVIFQHGSTGSIDGRAYNGGVTFSKEVSGSNITTKWVFRNNVSIDGTYMNTTSSTSTASSENAWYFIPISTFIDEENDATLLSGESSLTTLSNGTTINFNTSGDYTFYYCEDGTKWDYTYNDTGASTSNRTFTYTATSTANFVTMGGEDGTEYLTYVKDTQLWYPTKLDDEGKPTYDPDKSYSGYPSDKVYIVVSGSGTSYATNGISVNALTPVYEYSYADPTKFVRVGNHILDDDTQLESSYTFAELTDFASTAHNSYDEDTTVYFAVDFSGDDILSYSHNNVGDATHGFGDVSAYMTVALGTTITISYAGGTYGSFEGYISAFSHTASSVGTTDITCNIINGNDATVASVYLHIKTVNVDVEINPYNTVDCSPTTAGSLSPLYVAVGAEVSIVGDGYIAEISARENELTSSQSATSSIDNPYTLVDCTASVAEGFCPIVGGVATPIYVQVGATVSISDSDYFCEIDSGGISGLTTGAHRITGTVEGTGEARVLFTENGNGTGNVKVVRIISVEAPEGDDIGIEVTSGGVTGTISATGNTVVKFTKGSMTFNVTISAVEDSSDKVGHWTNTSSDTVYHNGLVSLITETGTTISTGDAFWKNTAGGVTQGSISVTIPSDIPYDLVLVTLDFVNQKFYAQGVTPLKGLKVADTVNYNLAEYQYPLSVSDHPTYITSLSFYKDGGTRVFIKETWVQLDPMNLLWGDPYLYLYYYYPNLFTTSGEDIIPEGGGLRILFNGFVAYGDSLTINGVEITVNEDNTGTFTVDDVEHTIYLKGMAVDFKDGHVYLVDTEHKGATYDLGEYNQTTQSVMRNGVATGSYDRVAYTIIGEGAWYWYANVYNIQVTETTEMQIDLSKGLAGWEMSLQVTVLLFIGMLILSVAGVVYMFRDSEPFSFLDWFIIGLTIVILFSVMSL